MESEKIIVGLILVLICTVFLSEMLMSGLRNTKTSDEKKHKEEPQTSDKISDMMDSDDLPVLTNTVDPEDLLDPTALKAYSAPTKKDGKDGQDNRQIDLFNTPIAQLQQVAAPGTRQSFTGFNLPSELSESHPASADFDDDINFSNIDVGAISVSSARSCETKADHAESTSKANSSTSESNDNPTKEQSNNDSFGSLDAAMDDVPLWD